MSAPNSIRMIDVERSGLDAVAEIAKLRGFVETVASQSAAPYTSPAANLASMGSWMQRLVDEALELLAEIDDKED